MAKFHGVIGYIKTVETPIGSGVWKETIIEREYYGDIKRHNFHSQTSGNVNDDINIKNEISVIADAYANENTGAMRYIEFMGAKWKIISAEVRYPRLILNIGGVYNG